VSRLSVAVVMPPATDRDHAAALASWPTFTKTLEALLATGQIDPVGCCRTVDDAAVVTLNGVEYFFEKDDPQLARRVAALHPHIVQVHGLGFTRLMIAIRRAVGRRVPILAQHHGEPPPTALRSRIGQQVTRRVVDGYLFTGADQAEAFRRAGVISRSAPVYEVLESASHLDAGAPSDGPKLSGLPSVLWVGRLISSKDPLCAVRAVAAARRRHSSAELHMLATDRSMEPEVRQLIESLGLDDVVHLHQAVTHADMPGWYRRADTYLSTSRREGSNYSLIEALGLGCWPIVTDIPSHAAIVKDLSRRFAVGDADDAGRLLAAPAGSSRNEVLDHSLRCLSWSSIADQLVGTYRRSQKT